MKTKIIIPRKDHEVYFIPMPEGLKQNMVQRFVFDKLNELHPDFSAVTRVDIKTFLFDKAHWIMATVIADEILAEYQILHRDTVFYTNTSILAHTSGFTANEPCKVDDELIGYDFENKTPVSIPTDAVLSSESQKLAVNIKHIPSSYGVFRKEKPKWLFATIPAGIVLLVFLLIMYASAGIPDNTNIPVVIDYHAEQEIEIAVPSAFVILSNIAELFLQANGEISRWQFVEGASPAVIIQCSGISALTAHTVFSRLEYLSLDDIQIVNYVNNNPFATISLRMKQNTYLQPAYSIFPRQSMMIAAAFELTNLLTSRGITIMSETLPSVENNFEMYTINYIVNDNNFTYAIEAIEKLCEKHSLLVRRFDITAGSDKRSFNIICSLSPSAMPDVLVSVPDDKKQRILLAFGYKPSAVSFTHSVITVQPSDRTSLIGTISDSGGQTIFYHDSDGKIGIRGGR